MPGHPIPGHLLEEAKADVKRLEELIKEHDVVYLLMDSRESRWLPTVIGASLGKVSSSSSLGDGDALTDDVMCTIVGHERRFGIRYLLGDETWFASSSSRGR